MAESDDDAIVIGQRFEVRATPQARYSFTAQYIGGAMLLARRAAGIETQPDPDELARAEHRALVVGAIMQACSAIESELADVLQHGPGHHLGSNGIDDAARAFLEPVADLVDRSPGALERWRLLLLLLRKPLLEKGSHIYQEADLLVDLRNELVHYRSYWGGRTKTGKLLDRLRAKNFRAPAFVLATRGSVNDFPHAILGAHCALWACETAADFLDHVYDLLGVRGVLEGHRIGGATFETVMPKKRAANRASAKAPGKTPP